MTVTLSDFTWAVRPTVSDVELTDGGDIVASSGWTAGVGGWAAWDTTTALEALTDEYTIVVVLDPNQASSAWRGLLSIPACASGAHASPYHVMLLAASGLGDPTKLAYYQSIANVGAVYQSATGAIDTSTDGQTCYAVRRSGTNVDYLVDGVEVSSSTVAAGALDWTPHGPVCLGTRSASAPGEGCAGTYVFAGVADRALTDDELAAITASPLGFEGGDVTGTIAATLANLTSTITGTGTITGTIAATLANLTSTITGTGTIAGTVAATLANLTSTITGTGTIAGTVAATLANLTSTITGTGPSPVPSLRRSPISPRRSVTPSTSPAPSRPHSPTSRRRSPAPDHHRHHRGHTRQPHVDDHRLPRSRCPAGAVGAHPAVAGCRSARRRRRQDRRGDRLRPRRSGACARRRAMGDDHHRRRARARRRRIDRRHRRRACRR